MNETYSVGGFSTTCDSSNNLSGTSSYSTATGTSIVDSGWSVKWDMSSLLSKEDKEELLKKLLESENDLMPILKEYLVGYLDKILDNPEPLIKDLIKEKDEKIQELSKRLDDLEKRVSELSKIQPPYIVNPIEPFTIGNPKTVPDITWTGSGDIYCGTTV